MHFPLAPRLLLVSVTVSILRCMCRGKEETFAVKMFVILVSFVLKYVRKYVFIVVNATGSFAT